MKNEQTFLMSLEQNICKFIDDQKELLYNEQDFQMHLAIFLMNECDYNKIHVEYYIPYKEVADYDYLWKQDLRLDIVVEKDGMFAVVELKYATKCLPKGFKEITRFDTTLDDGNILKNQAAQNETKYRFWKDVRRIEIVKERFPGKVVGGFAVMLTNDHSYRDSTGKNKNYEAFSTVNGRTVYKNETLAWKGTSADKKKFPPFALDGTYTVKWEPKDIEGIGFIYTILRIV